MPKPRRPKAFSVVKAVKANARARVGTPPPGAPIADRKTKALHGAPKHKSSLEGLLHAVREEENV